MQVVVPLDLAAMAPAEAEQGDAKEEEDDDMIMGFSTEEYRRLRGLCVAASVPLRVPPRGGRFWRRFVGSST